MKELWKSVKNWQSYHHEFSVLNKRWVLRFWDTVYNRAAKGVFIATQLNSTRRRVVESTRSQREQLSHSDPVDSVCRSWRHKQKHDWLGCTLFNWVGWVELCRYRHPSIATQLNSTRRRVQLSCVAINTHLVMLLNVLINCSVLCL